MKQNSKTIGLKNPTPRNNRRGKKPLDLEHIAPALKKHQYWALAKITGLKKPSPEIDRRGKNLVNFAKAILR